MKKVGDNNVSSIYIGDRAIIYVYLGNQLIWSKDNSSDIQSCFAQGYWIDEYPWTDDLPWKD